MYTWGFIFALLMFASCSTRHEQMAGNIVLKISEEKGVACFLLNNSKVGDKLSVFNTECYNNEYKRKRQAIRSCRLVKAGEVEITEILNEHYSEFKALSSLTFQEGSLLRSGDIID